jgi:hypothetical protein
VTLGRAALLAAALVTIPGPAAAQSSRDVFVVRTEGIAFPAALRHADIRRIVRAGGIGLLAGDRFVDPVRLDPDQDSGIQLVELEPALSSSGADEVMVIVIGSAQDRPNWLALATGPAEQILEGDGSPGGLTSDTTTRPGVVAAADLGPTVRGYLGLPVSDESPGSPIRVEGEPPTDLYDRALDYRKVVIPVGLFALALAIGSLVVGFVLVVMKVPSPVARSSVSLAILFAVSVMVALVPASVLPSLETLVVAGGLVLIAGILTAVAMGWARRDPAVAIAVVAGAGLMILLLDGLLGWPTEVTPLLGGGAILGVRFFGLGNAAAGIVLSGAALGAAYLRPRAGVVVLAAAALFAGLPFLGADLGGGVTLAATAGLWYGWRVRSRLDVTAWAVAAAAAVVGAAVLVAIHAAWPEPTHVSRAVESGGAVGTFLDRLASNVRATTEIWPAWLTVIGLPFWLVMAWRGAGPFGSMLDRRPAWRAGVMILAIGGMIGFVVNDTYGMAAVAFTFISAAMIYPALRERWTSG